MQQLAAFIPMILVFVLFYFMIFVPEKKRKKQYNNMLNSLAVNDEVMTKGGIMGRIINLQDEFFILESGPDRARLKMNKLAIASISKKANESAEVK